MDSLASRYSSALLSIAEEENKVIDYHQACKILLQCLKENPEYMRIISSSFLNDKVKKKLIKEVVSKFDLPNFLSFIYVIVDNNRVNALIEILEDFNSKCNETQDILEGTIYSVTKLKADQIARIEKAISCKMKKKVELKNEINVNLIGGVKVVVNDTVFDGSIQNKVDSLKHALLKGGH